MRPSTKWVALTLAVLFVASVFAGANPANIAQLKATKQVPIYFGLPGSNAYKMGSVMLARPADAWAHHSDLPAGLMDNQAAASATNQYVVGGYYSTALYQNDMVSTVWNTLAAMPFSIANGAADIIGDTLYVYGGYDYSAGTMPNNMLKYSLSANTWTTAAGPYPSGTPYGWAMRGTAVGGKLYYISGCNDPSSGYLGQTNQCWAYTPGVGWATIAPINQARVFGHVWGYHDTVWVAGGIDMSMNVMTQTEFYVPATNTWYVNNAVFPQLPAGRWAGATATPGAGCTKGIMYTGVDPAFAIVNNVYVFDFGTKTWTSEPAYAAHLVYRTAGAGNANGQALNFGGSTGGFSPSTGVDFETYLPPVNDDVGISAAGVLAYTACVGDPQTIHVTITNYGLVSQSTIPLWYDIGAGPVNELWQDLVTPLAPGASIDYDFAATWTPSAVGSVALTASTALPGDGHPSNDAKSTGVDIWPLGTKVGQLFNNTTFPPPGWSSQIVSGSMDWQRSTGPTIEGFYPLEGAMAMYDCWDAYPPGAARLISHTFNVGPVGREVDLDFWLHQEDYWGTYDSTYVDVTTNGGASWTQVAGYRNNDGNFLGWNKKTINCGSYAGGTDLQFAFRGVTDWYYNCLVDSARCYLVFRDVGVSAIVSPPPAVTPGFPYMIRIDVTNYGIVPATFNLGVMIGGSLGDTTHQGLNAQTLAAGVTQQFVMPTPWVGYAGGVYAMRCSTYMVGDGDPTNDLMLQTIVTGTIDVACNGITVPAGNVDTAMTVIPAASFTNNGDVAATFLTTYTIDDGTDAIIYQDTATLTLDPDASVTFAYDEWAKPHAIGAYTAKCSLYVSGDNNTGNNVATKPFQVQGTVLPGGWVERKAIPNLPTPKGAYYGSWLVNAGDANFAAKGGKVADFYKYIVADDSWTQKTLWPMGVENKNPGKGGAACYDGEQYIYATKGNNTQGFWRYDVLNDSWKQMDDVPLGASGKKVKEGTGAVYAVKGGNPYVYLLKGYKTEMWAFDVTADSWIAKTNIPVATQKIKNGSWMTGDGAEDGYLYAAQANYLEFWQYNVANDSWSKKLASYPSVYTINNPRNRAKKLKAGGCGAYLNAAIYSLKGGNTVQFFKYDVANDSWTSKESIPMQASYGLKKAKVKDGGTMTVASGSVYAFKGGKTFEHWRYFPGSGLFASAVERGGVMGQVSAITRGMTVSPNPLSSGYATLSYNLPKAGALAVTVHDVTGRTVMTKTVVAGRTGSMALDLHSLNAGVYLVKLTSDGYTSAQKLVVQH